MPRTIPRPVLSTFLPLMFIVSIQAQDRDASKAKSNEPQEKEQVDLQRLRSEWFYSQRAYPHRFVPAGAHINALKQLNSKLKSETALRTAAIKPGAHALLGNPAWISIGPKPTNTPFTDGVVSGRVAAMVVDPRSNNTVYLGAAQGGVWKTTDGGGTWTPLTDTQESLAIGAIALDPSHPDTLYVGTGEENFSGDSYYGAGILKSVNGGSTWTQICGPFCGPINSDSYYGGGAHIGGLAVQPTNSNVVLAAVSLLFKDGIYRSADGGSTWTKVLGGNPGTAVFYDPTNGSVAYAALGNSFSGGPEGVYKSTDGGQTWTAVNGTGGNTLSLANAGRIALTMAPSNTAILYAGIENISTSSLLGFYKTTDGGANWTQLSNTPDYCTPQCWYDNTITVQPTNLNVVYAGGAFSTTLVRTLDGGATWSTLQSAASGGTVHADMHALAFTPDGTKLYLGNDGGAYSTAQPAATTPSFIQLNATLATLQFYPGISIHPTNPSIAFGGTKITVPISTPAQQRGTRHMFAAMALTRPLIPRTQITSM